MTSRPRVRESSQDRSRALARSLYRQDSVPVRVKLLDVWGILSRPHDKVHYDGMYEILDYDATLGLVDLQGE